MIWDEEMKKRRRKRKEEKKEGKQTHSVKSKPFQTVTKRYWCLFCVVIDTSVQLAEILT